MIIELTASCCCEECGGSCADGTCTCGCCGGKKLAPLNATPHTRNGVGRRCFWGRLPKHLNSVVSHLGWFVARL